MEDCRRKFGGLVANHLAGMGAASAGGAVGFGLGFDPAADVLLDCHGGEGRKKRSLSSWRVCYNLPGRAVFANLVEISHGGARRRVENRMF